MILMMASGPVGIAVNVGMAVFGICNAVFGWSDDVEGRGRMLCMSDISDVLCDFVNKYYLYDDVSDPIMTHTESKLIKYVSLLLDARIRGENNYIEVYDNEVSRCENARDNIDMVESIADRFGL